MTEKELFGIVFGIIASIIGLYITVTKYEESKNEKVTQPFKEFSNDIIKLTNEISLLNNNLKHMRDMQDDTIKKLSALTETTYDHETRIKIIERTHYIKDKRDL